MSGKNSSYFLVNFIFVIIIGIVFIYSYFFYPNNHPVECLVKNITGKDCSACGFSRAFSSFSHFEFKQGMLFNKLAFNCFLFLVFQFFFRSILSIISLYYNFVRWFVLLDVCITIVFFLLAFSPLIY